MLIFKIINIYFQFGLKGANQKCHKIFQITLLLLVK